MNTFFAFMMVCTKNTSLSYLVFSSLPKLVTSLTVAVVSVYVIRVMRRVNKVCSTNIFIIINVSNITRLAPNHRPPSTSVLLLHLKRE